MNKIMQYIIKKFQNQNITLCEVVQTFLIFSEFCPILNLQGCK